MPRELDVHTQIKDIIKPTHITAFVCLVKLGLTPNQYQQIKESKLKLR